MNSVDNLIKTAQRYSIKLAQQQPIEQSIADYELAANNVFKEIHSLITMAFEKKPTIRDEFLKNCNMIQTAFYKFFNAFKTKPNKPHLDQMKGLVINFTNWSKRDDIKLMPEPYKSSLMNGIANVVNRFLEAHSKLEAIVK